MWSLEHACLDDEEREEILERWKILWREFLINVINWDRKRGDSASAVEEKPKM